MMEVEEGGGTDSPVLRMSPIVMPLNDPPLEGSVHLDDYSNNFTIDGQSVESVRDLLTYIHNKKNPSTIIELKDSVPTLKRILDKRVNELNDKDIFKLIDTCDNPVKSNNSNPLLLTHVINVKFLADRFRSISSPYNSSQALVAFKVINNYKINTKISPDHESLLEALNYRISRSKTEIFTAESISEGFSCLKCLEPTKEVLRLLRILGEKAVQSKDHDDIKCKNFMMAVGGFKNMSEYSEVIATSLKQLTAKFRLPAVLRRQQFSEGFTAAFFTQGVARLQEMECLNHLLKALKILMQFCRTPGNNAASKPGDTSVLLDLCEFVAKALDYLKSTREDRCKGVICFVLGIVSGSTMRDPQILKLCSALSRYADSESISIESNFIPFIINFVVLLHRCESRPREVDDLIGTLAKLLQQRKITPSILQIAEKQLTKMEMPSPKLNSSHILHGLQHWSSQSPNILRLVMVLLQSVCMQDSDQYCVEDIGRVICACRYLRDNPTVHTYDLDELAEYNKFIQNMLLIPFAQFQFSKDFCRLFCGGLATFREDDPIFQHMMKEFCAGLREEINESFPLEQIINVIGKVGKYSSAWISPGCRDLLSIGAQKLEASLAVPRSGIRITFQQVVQLLHSLRCCCFRVPEVEQLLNALWLHVQLLEPSTITTTTCTLHDLVQIFRGISLLPTDLLMQANCIQIISFFFQWAGKTLAMNLTSLSSVAVRSDVFDLIQCLARCMCVLVEADVARVDLTEFLQHTLSNFTFKVIPQLGEGELSKLLYVHANLLQYIPSDAKYSDFFESVTFLCAQSLPCLDYSMKLSSGEGEDVSVELFDVNIAAKILLIVSTERMASSSVDPIFKFIFRVLKRKLHLLDEVGMANCLEALRFIRSAGHVYLGPCDIDDLYLKAIDASLQMLYQTLSQDCTFATQDAVPPENGKAISKALVDVDCANLFRECTRAVVLFKEPLDFPTSMYQIFRQLGSFYKDIISNPDLRVQSDSNSHVLNIILEHVENIVIDYVVEILFVNNVVAFHSIEVRCITNGVYSLLSLEIPKSQKRLLLDVTPPWEHIPSTAGTSRMKEQEVRCDEALHICRRCLKIDSFNAVASLGQSSTAEAMRAMWAKQLYDQLLDIFTSFQLIIRPNCAAKQT